LLPRKGETVGQDKRKKAKIVKGNQIGPTSGKNLARFLLLFVVLAVGFFALFYFWKSGVEHLQEWTALLSARLLSLFGFPVEVTGITYSSSGVAIEIIPECTGLYEIIIFSAILLAYPGIWWKKLVGVGTGIAILFILNLIRLLILALIGMRDPQLMEWVHLYLWQLTLILFVVGLFLIWLSWIRRPVPKVFTSPASSQKQAKTSQKGEK
jgi:exosortase H (IPTLxxWG-CTERM-specific)